MTNEHKLPYTAEEIEKRLAGVGLPYFALTATTVLGEAVDLADEDRAALLSIIDPMVSSGKALPIVAAIQVDGIVLTTVLSAVSNIVDASDNWQITYGGNIWTAEVVLSVELIVNSAGMATIKVDTIDISGADTEAIAAELEAVIDGKY